VLLPRTDEATCWKNLAVGLTTAADVAYVTAMADADETRQIGKATAQESYVHTIADARETYLVGMSEASRDLAAGGEQSTYDSTVSSTADTYRADAAGASGDRRVDLAEADKDYTDAMYGPSGAALTWKSGRAGALKTFSIAESTARADRESALATLRCDYLTLEAQTYATALAALATASGTPWAALAADEAAAEYDRLAEILSEEALLDIAAATAARDFEIADATETETRTTAESSATAAREVALADAALDRAGEEAAAAVALTDDGALPPGIGMPVVLIGTPTDNGSETYIRSRLGQWGLEMMAETPVEQWDDEVEQLIALTAKSGHPLAQDIAADLRRWISMEQDRQLILVRFAEDMRKGMVAKEDDLSRRFRVRFQGESDDSDKRRVFESLARIESRIRAIIAEIEYELDTLSPEMRGELGLELTQLRFVFWLMETDMASGHFLLRIRHYKFRGEDPPSGRWRFIDGAVELNDAGPRTWKELSDEELDVVLFHELSHNYGTLDHSGMGEFYNAHRIERLVLTGLSKSAVYTWMKRYAELKLKKHWRAETYEQPYRDGRTWREKIDFLIRLWELLP
jgi:hypothetical protein